MELAIELARLLVFTGRLATVTRMNSSYGGGLERNPRALEDVRWLTDALHNFGVLGLAVQTGDEARIISACDLLLETYRAYREPGPAACFERHAEFINLAEGEEIFRAIRAKAARMSC